ncbi:FAD-dependent oxidoreductase [Christensenellaceae bacterium OttesenSCG-928-M15]|nr:FAD-dependent oxidoreductase [Christensenellaceae bacterium OttesenSCG-928-M15]
MKRFLALSLSMLMLLALLAGCTQPASDPATSTEPTATDAPPDSGTQQPDAQGGVTFTPGTYTSTVSGMHGPLSVEVTVSSDAITDVKVTEHMETPGVGDVSVEQIPAAIVAEQSLAVDTVTGVTITRGAILRAVEECLSEAGADVAALKVAKEAEKPQDVELTADVVIVGGGGAGLSAAISAVQQGASVILVEKTGFLGGNSIVAGGIYNAPDPSKQDHHEETRSEALESLITDAINETPVSDEHKELMATVKAEYEEYLKSDKTLFDSPNWFALQTWNGGDKLAVLSNVKTLTANALDCLQWFESMGMEFEPGIKHGGGSLYPRTHTAVEPNGVGYIKAITRTLEGEANYTQLMNVNATSLIMDGNKVVGVEGEGKEGNKVTLHANNGVVLTTGGFAGNVDLRVKYAQSEKWPDLSAKVPTSNMPGVTGDGIFMAEAAGAELVNMDQIQLLPYCNPQNGATYDICSGTTNVFINKEGKRFVREDGRRDDMSRAIIAQTDGLMYFFNGNGDGKMEERVALGGQKLTYYLETNHSGYVTANTLEEMAELLDVPADALIATIEEFNKNVENDTADEFGRVSYSGKLEAPYHAYTRKPAVHHTMGGVRIDEQTHALAADGTPVPGLYCAGEITGVVHGANRLGGNAIVDFAVYGRIAGEAAAKGE